MAPYVHVPVHSSMKDYESGGKDFCTFVNIYKPMKVRLGMQGMQVQMGPVRMEARRAKGGLLIETRE